MKKVLLLFAVSAFALSSCNDKDDEIIGKDCVTKIMKYSDEISASQLKYGQDDSVENCKNYQKAIQNYLDNTKDCVGASPATYQAILETLECE